MQPSSSVSRMEESASRRQRHRIATLCLGLGSTVCGFLLLAVSPDTPASEILWRLAAGFSLLIGGFITAVIPVLLDAIGMDEV
jgi:hypothetical protein